MTPEDLALKVLNEGYLNNLSRRDTRFTPFIELRIDTGHYFVKETSSPLVGSLSFRVRNIALFVTVNNKDFSSDEWRDIPKKLKKGLTRLHEKGELIPIIKAHTLL